MARPMTRPMKVSQFWNMIHALEKEQMNDRHHLTSFQSSPLTYCKKREKPSKTLINLDYIDMICNYASL